MKEIKELSRSFDVISFDVFDTLLVRNVLNPKDVWRALERRECAAGFFAEREAADRTTYAEATRRGGEHTLDEAYAKMDSRWAAFREKELDAERKALFANPEVVDLWNEAGRLGKKRVLVSDMYLPRVEIENLLRTNGISGWDGLFVSSEQGCRKTTGRLFERMLEKMAVAPARVMHIGDNRESDFDVPQRLGMTAFLYPTIRERLFEECPLSREFLSCGGLSTEKELLVGALAQGWHAFKCARPSWTFWHKIGFFYGGVLGFAYVRWIGLTARKMGIGHLMFVGRDGYIWQKMANALFPDLRSDYFYAPRTMSIRVLGAVGNEPNAIRDRQRYMDEFLSGNDPERAKAEYAAYLARFKIDAKKTALIDGMSSGFSAQRLVEKTLGTEVFTFYLLAYSTPKPGASFYESKMDSISFQNFSEFIFSSPEPPLARVMAEGAVFSPHVNAFEQVKISHAEEIAEAAVACAAALGRAEVLVTPQDFQDYFDVGMRTLSAEDRFHLSVARNSTDVAHRRYAPIAVPPRLRLRTWISFRGIPVFKIRYAWRNGWNCRTLLFLGRIPVFWRKTQVYKLADVSERDRKSQMQTVRRPYDGS